MKIQIVEDDRTLSDGIVMALGGEDFSFVQNGSIRQAQMAFERESFALIVLDLNLPDGSGYEYLKWVRKVSHVPVLILTANDMEMDEVMGFHLGADDYVTKPFHLAVLRARIQSLLRRAADTGASAVYTEGPFSFDFERLLFTCGGEKILLSPNEQKLLRVFVDNPGRLLARSVLIDRIWSEEGEFVDENALSVIINRLRGKLEGRNAQATYIQTIYGQGYMWKKKEIL